MSTANKAFPGFEHEGMWITNPTAEARGQVSPEYYGFEIHDTGGGCTAWVKTFDDGSRIMLTDTDGVSHAFLDGADTEFMLGFYKDYDDDGTTWIMKVGEVPEEDPAGYDVRAFLSNSFGADIAALWVEVLEEEVLDCPVESAVGNDSTELIFAAQSFINMMADIDDEAREAIRRAAARQCEVFYFG